MRRQRRPLAEGLVGGLGGVLVAALAGGLVGGCGGGPPEAPAVETPAPSPRQTALSPLQAVDCYLGVIAARQQIDVVAETEGIVEDVAVRLGDRVEAGDELARLVTRALTHRLDIEKADRNNARALVRQRALEAENAERDLERRVALGDLLSREEEESARFRRDAAEAAHDAARAELERVSARIAELQSELERSRLKAPFAGRVARRYVDPGARVMPGSPVVHLLHTDELLTRFSVPPETAATLETGRTVRVELLEPPIEVEGVIEQWAPEIDPASLMVFVEARLEATGVLADVPLGAEARVSVEAGEETPSCRARSAISSW